MLPSVTDTEDFDSVTRSLSCSVNVAVPATRLVPEPLSTTVSELSAAVSSTTVSVTAAVPVVPCAATVIFGSVDGASV